MYARVIASFVPPSFANEMVLSPSLRFAISPSLSLGSVTLDVELFSVNIGFSR